MTTPNSLATPRSQSVWLTPLGLVLLSLLASAVLVVIAALLYSYSPLALALSGVSVVILLVTSAGVWWLGRRATTDPTQTDAIKGGLLLGLLWVIEISINNFLAPPLPGRDQIDNAFWAAIALGILGLAVAAAYRANRVRAGLLSGAWSGLVSGALACLMGVGVVVLGMGFLLRDPLNLAEWAARGPDVTAPSMASYFAFETLAGGMLHLTVLGLVMGLLLGGLGGLIGKGARIAGRLAGRRER